VGEGTLKYGSIIDEWSTLEECAQGKSLARFGDGELKLMDGQGYFREPHNDKLGAELLQVLQHPAENCLVGVPTMNPEGPKFTNWCRHAERFAKLFNPEVTYYSAFVTRPDSAPWIYRENFALLFQSLWAKKRVTVMSERDNKIFTLVQRTAGKLKHVICPHSEAYAQIDELEEAIADTNPAIALLSCGPTATCMANRLAVRGIQAIDIGSAGGYLLKLLAQKDHSE